MPDLYKSFTLVFEGDIRQFKNPFKTETPFGIPYAASVGDALQENDQLREGLERSPAQSQSPSSTSGKREQQP